MINSKEIPEYDEVEIFENVTVQILKSSKTGDISIGWYRQPNTIEGGDEYIPKAEDENKKPEKAALKLGHFKFIAVDNNKGLGKMKLIHKVRPKRRSKQC